MKKGLNKNLHLVYENKWVLDRIYKASDNLRNKVTYQIGFEYRCMNRVADYLAESKDNHRNKHYINKLIQQVAADYPRRYRPEEYEVFVGLSSIGEDGSEVEFEPVDVLADVESELSAKEMIALLAQDDRSKMILESWTNGDTNSKAIADMLAHNLGGKKESHRKFITRFKGTCRQRLATAI